MKKSSYIRVIIIATLAVPAVFLFQNFSKHSQKQTSKNRHSWTAKGFQSMKASTSSNNMPRPVICQQNEWALVIDFHNVEDRQKLSGIITNQSTGAQIEFAEIGLPHTIGPCQVPATDNQFKLCVSDERGYRYNFELSDAYDENFPITKFAIFRSENSCDERPQRTHTKFKNYMNETF